jgi:hypothetical protein
VADVTSSDPEEVATSCGGVSAFRRSLAGSVAEEARLLTESAYACPRPKAATNPRCYQIAIKRPLRAPDPGERCSEPVDRKRERWSGRRDSNSRPPDPQALQGGVRQRPPSPASACFPATWAPSGFRRRSSMCVPVRRRCCQRCYQAGTTKVGNPPTSSVDPPFWQRL